MSAFFKLIRIKNLIIIVLLQYLLRYGLLIPILEYFGMQPVLSDFRFALLVITTVLLAASGYVVNDYFDIKIDRINRPEKVVAGTVFRRRTVLLIHLFLTFAGVFTGFFLSYIYKKENYALMFIIIPILLWYYSTTFKKQMIVGNVIISLLSALVPYFVVSLEFAALIRVHGETIIDTEACSTAWFWTTGFAFFAFINTLIREIIKDMEDEKGDKKEGCRTLPIAMGIKNTKTFVFVLTLVSVLAIWALFFGIDLLKNSQITLFYFLILLTIPFLALAWNVFKAKNSKDFHRSSQISKIIMLFGILFILVARMFFIGI